MGHPAPSSSASPSPGLVGGSMTSVPSKRTKNTSCIILTFKSITSQPLIKVQEGGGHFFTKVNLNIVDMIEAWILAIESFIFEWLNLVTFVPLNTFGMLKKTTVNVHFYTHLGKTCYQEVV